ncbi:MAG: class I SAM-dependent methyltransferase [Planctomycetota bacterium]
MPDQLFRITRRIRSKLRGNATRPPRDLIRAEKRAIGEDPFSQFLSGLQHVEQGSPQESIAPAIDRQHKLHDLLSGEMHETSFRHKVQQMDASEVLAAVSSPTVGLDIIYLASAAAPPGWRVELGSAFGIGTVAICAAELGTDNPIDGIEYEAWRAEIAQEGARELIPDRAAVHAGDIGEVLPRLATQRPAIGFAFVDAMHTHKATMGYHNLLEQHAARGAMVLYDDLSWSNQMERAWRDIVAAASVTDAIRIGDRWGLVRYIGAPTAE